MVASRPGTRFKSNKMQRVARTSNFTLTIAVLSIHSLRTMELYLFCASSVGPEANRQISFFSIEWFAVPFFFFVYLFYFLDYFFRASIKNNNNNNV